MVAGSSRPASAGGFGPTDIRYSERTRIEETDLDDTIPDIDGLVIDALERLPPPFRERLGSVAIVVDDEPSPTQLAEVGARGLFGLYQGVPRTTYGVDGATVPSKITLFRGPLLRASGTPSALADLVADTVYHEIAHHLGISDGRLRELRDERGRSRR